MDRGGLASTELPIRQHPPNRESTKTPGREGEQDESVCTTFPRSDRHNDGDRHSPRTRRPSGERRTGRTARGRVRQPQQQHDRQADSSACPRTGVTEHLEAFQAIADANGGTRAAGLPGYDASVDYVVDTLDSRGLERLASMSSTSPTWVPPSSSRLTPAAAALRDRCLHRHRLRDGPGQRHPGRSHLASPREHHQRLRGERTSRVSTSPERRTSRSSSAAPAISAVKAVNAQAAGAEAVVIMNQGNPRPAGSDRRNASARDRARYHPGRRAPLR